jgi:leucine-zipper of insertion element IS481
VPHANARLTERGRLRLARCVVEEGWSLRRAAERFQVSVPTAKRWADRYHAEGVCGMVDRSAPEQPGHRWFARSSTCAQRRSSARRCDRNRAKGQGG